MRCTTTAGWPAPATVCTASPATPSSAQRWAWTVVTSVRKRTPSSHLNSIITLSGPGTVASSAGSSLSVLHHTQARTTFTYFRPTRCSKRQSWMHRRSRLKEIRSWSNCSTGQQNGIVSYWAQWTTCSWMRIYAEDEGSRAAGKRG